MSIQNILSTAHTYGANALNWVTTNGSAVAHKIAELAMRVWNIVQPHLESLKNLVMANQGIAAVVGVVGGAVVVTLASCTRVTNFFRNALGMGPATPAPAPSGATAPAPSGATAPAPSGATAPAPSSTPAPIDTNTVTATA